MPGCRVIGERSENEAEGFIHLVELGARCPGVDPTGRDLVGLQQRAAVDTVVIESDLVTGVRRVVRDRAACPIDDLPALILGAVNVGDLLQGDLIYERVVDALKPLQVALPLTRIVPSGRLPMVARRPKSSPFATSNSPSWQKRYLSPTSTGTSL